MRRRALAVAATVAFAAVAAGAPARAAVVELRVDSSTGPAPLFEGTVETLPHPVDGGDGSGPHPCSGPPGAPPSATATGALDDAMRSAAIPWRGNWDPSFRDFFVDRIGPYASAAPDRYWSLTVNGRFSSGGCLARVEDGDSVVFHYGPLFGMDGGAEPGTVAGSPAASGEDRPPKADSGPARARLRRLGAAAAAYLRRTRDGAGAEWGALALALRRGAGSDGTTGALLGARLSRLRDGSIGGDVNATALAVLALERRRPRAAAAAATWLASVQGSGGGFGFRPEAPPDVDTTGLAAWALARSGRTAAARRGAVFVRAAQSPDGGFPAIPGGTPNSQSTGLALVALRVAGLGPRVRSSAGATPLDFLASLARPDGSIAYSPSAAPTPVWTTAQALLGLTGRAKLLAGDAPRAAPRIR